MIDPQDKAFTEAERATVYRAIEERRDMRHFRPDPIDPVVLQRLLHAVHQAPSVGLMQPWRFIRIVDSALRHAIHTLVELKRLLTAQALGERSGEFLRLKAEGIRECAELLVVALSDNREQFVFGRRTLPEMDLASVACAIQNLWLAARAEGLGMGWVSLFEPQSLAELLAIPEGGKPIAVLCLGHVDSFYDQPLLTLENWRQPLPLSDLLFQDTWGNRANFASE
jgi:5,6-dimethylbenzimidazole synthase